MSLSLIVLTIVIVIIVIVMTNNWISAVLIISLLANFALIMRPDLLSECLEAVKTEPKQEAKPEPKAESKSELIPDSKQPIDIYGPFYEQYHAYNRSYDFYDPVRPIVEYSCGERNYTIDSANALMAQQRARDKKCSDGWASKDRYYFQHHFADELDEEEDKVWWNRNEY